jgi:uncharacterized protein YkwD
VGRALRRLAAVALLTTLASPVSTSAEYRLDGTEVPDHAWREPLLDLLNAQRARQGLRPLKLNRKLNAAAEDRIRDMFERRYFGHVAPDGTRPDVWVGRRGYRYAALGENLATGQRSAPEVVRQWMRSRGHRATLLGKFEHAGIAIAAGSPSGRARGHTVVALFARERDRR